MEFKTFSHKQKTVLTWWCPDSPNYGKDAIICDGAVRSGKTFCMSLSFVCWAFYRFHNESFAFCGKTLTSLRRNLITPLIAVLIKLGFTCKEKLNAGILEISNGRNTNRFYLFAGRDEGSAALIQGVTLAGVLLDEVALMPKSFVEQALARCSIPDSRIWFNCNPEYPGHWFLNEWILKAAAKNALYLHFTMEDNPALTAEIRKRYERLYSGVFYNRFIKGEWTAAEGLVYGFFGEQHIVGNLDGAYQEYVVSADYGTVNPSSFGLWGLSGDVWIRIHEYYFDSRKEGIQRTDEEHYKALQSLCRGLPVREIIIDPYAASFIACIRRHGEYVPVPAKNDVLNGIRRVGDALKEGKILISSNCKDAIREFSLYRWDTSSIRDCPKKENDHAMDDIRYFVSTKVDREPEEFYAAAVLR